MNTSAFTIANTDTISVITVITYAFFLYLLLAIAVERTVEILMAIFKYLEYRLKWYGFWDARAQAVRRYLDRIFAFKAVHPNESDNQLSWLLWKLMVPTAVGRPDVISADIIRAKALRTGSGTIALLLSLIVVYALNVDPKMILSNLVQNAPDIKFLSPLVQWRHIRMIVLAAAISIGSDPLHQVISSIETYAKGNTANQKGGA